MASITHSVYTCQLHESVDLTFVANHSRDAVYTHQPFHRLLWKDRRVGGTCLLYSNGKMIQHGTKRQLRRYLRLLQKMGLDISFSKIRLVTQTAVAYMSNVNYNALQANLNATYEPELFHACQLRRCGMHFTIFKIGKVVITGVKSVQAADATLVEIAWLQ